MNTSGDGDASHNEDVEAGRAMTRAGYRKLLEDIAENEDNIMDEETGGTNILQYLQNNDELYSAVDAPQEAVMDAVVMKHLSRLARQQAEQMSTNINQFKYEDYSNKLKASMNVVDRLDQKKWVMLGQQVKAMFKRAPPLSYMYGTLDTVPPEPKPKKTRETRNKNATKPSQLKETQAAVMTQTEKTVNQTVQIVAHVLKCLVLKWKDNGKNPLNYFKFVINPACFGSSIENMFHVSFLIKEGKAEISICPDSGEPLLQPVTKQQQTQTQDDSEDDVPKNQVVMSFSMLEWSALIRKHDIRHTMITALQL